jgi:hypothetical protein
MKKKELKYAIKMQRVALREALDMIVRQNQIIDELQKDQVDCWQCSEESEGAIAQLKTQLDHATQKEVPR